MRSSWVLAWPAYLVAALLLLAVTAGPGYPVVVGVGALALVLAIGPRSFDWAPRAGQAAIALAIYAACVSLFYVAFQVVTQDVPMGLFAVFGSGLLLGVVGPVLHVVSLQRRPLSDLGLTRRRLPETLALGMILAVVQGALTFPMVQFGPAETWLPLLVLALTVGLFEAVFFRAYLIAIFEPMLGLVPAVAVAAALYAAYHVGYGMTGEEMLFLAGLGVVYTIAYALTRSILVLWPLLTPLGSFFADVRGGEINLPLISILGFIDVLAVMAAAIYLAWRWTRRRRAAPLPKAHPA